MCSRNWQVHSSVENQHTAKDVYGSVMDRTVLGSAYI